MDFESIQDPWIYTVYLNISKFLPFLRIPPCFTIRIPPLLHPTSYSFQEYFYMQYSELSFPDLYTSVKFLVRVRKFASLKLVVVYMLPRRFKNVLYYIIL